MVSNLQRAISIPLASFINCESNPGTFIDFTSDPLDKLPDFSAGGGNGSGFSLRWDADGANSDTDSAVCSQITVPPDFVSNPSLRVSVSQVPPGGSVETLAVATRIHIGSASSPPPVPSPSGATTVALPIGSTPAVNDSLRIALQAGGATGPIDDALEVLAVEFVYTAEQ